MTSFLALTCPNCGASIPAGAMVCDYCRTRVLARGDVGASRQDGITCPACGIINATGRSFCSACAAGLTQSCPNCGRVDPIGTQYCGGCGLSPADARKQVLQKRVEAAKRNGWCPKMGTEYARLCESALQPGETVIIFHKRSGDPYLIESIYSGRKMVALVVTDRKFLFLAPGSNSWLGRRAQTVLAVPFDEVESISVDAVEEKLVITFEGYQAKMRLGVDKASRIFKTRSYWSTWVRTCKWEALGFISYFKPFLPARLLEGW